MNKEIVNRVVNKVAGATRRTQKARFLGLTIEKLLPNEDAGVESEIRVQGRCPFTGVYKDLPEAVLRELETCGVPQDKLLGEPQEFPEIKRPERVWRKYPVKGFAVEANFTTVMENDGNIKSVITDWASIKLVKSEFVPIRTTTFSL